MQELAGVEEEERMLELLKNSKFSLSAALAKLTLNEKDLVGAFLIGSRLWGTAGTQSDYDLVLVLSGKTQKEKWNAHSANVDANCFSKAEFSARATEHSFLCLLPYFIPQPWKLKQTAAMPPMPKLDKQKLLASVEREAIRDWSVAEKKGEKKQITEAKKVILHAIRMMRISVQIAAGGQVNVWCVSDLTEKFRDSYESSWAEVEDGWKGEFDVWLDKLRAACA